MKTPSLTVLMPVYNTEKYLREAIDSILQQTFTDFEFLIIDDCSTDYSPEIISSYTDPRIRVVRNEENMGMSATLNKGIQLCHTELIARMDADDISYPERLEKQYDFFQSNPGHALLYTWAKEITVHKETVGVEEYRPSYYYYCSNFENWIYHPTVMYKRSAVIDVGMYSVFYCEDYDLFWKMARKYKVGCLPEVLLDYRLSDESLCRVVRKAEYEQAHHEQVIRNIRYYTGDEFPLSYEEVECFRYRFEPVKKDNDIKKLVQCVQKLDYISSCILRKENVNRVEEDIKEAWEYKRGVIIEGLAQNLARKDKIQLHMATKEWKGLGNLILRWLK
jgi:glycosyltransferase involved in cell wall biosynthesis